MSVILDALKKAQNERKIVTGAVAGKFSKPSPRPRWVIYAALAGAVVVACALFVVPSLLRQKPNITVASKNIALASVPASDPSSKPATESKQQVLPVRPPLSDTGRVKAIVSGKETGEAKTPSGTGPTT